MLVIQHHPKIKDQVSIIPRLESDHLILEELRSEHARYVFKFASHDQVAKTVVWDAHRNIDDSLEYIKKIKLKLSNETGSIFLSWGVRSKFDGSIFGLVSLTQLEEHCLQIGYVFHYDRWSSKLPVEALLAVVQYAFNSMPEIERIQGRCFPSSVYSVGLMEQLEMHREKVNTITIKVRGEKRELNCYSLTRHHWNINRLKMFAKLKGIEYE